MITRERLETDLDTARAQKEQLLAQLNALMGAIQYIEQLLKTPETAPEAV